MNHLHQQLTLETLPDDVLIEILRLVARSPVPETRPLPFPIVASRVNRRFRAVALTSPTLWSTIRLSRRSRSWHWAPIFLSRSGLYPLDISINLEDYKAHSGSVCVCDDGVRYNSVPDAHISLQRALAIVGPHIARWRTFSLRCWASQLEELSRFMERSPVSAGIESAHISTVDNPWNEPGFLPPLAHVFGSPTFRFFRTNARLEQAALGAFKAIHTLDIDFGASHHPPDVLRTILGSSSPLRTLIMRTFSAAMNLLSAPIEATTITSLAVSFASDNFSSSGNFSDLTRAFSFPSLQYLEIVGGSLTMSNEYRTLFPDLHTLRLEGIDFTPIGLASIQSFSHGITTLELICTTNNHHLLGPRTNQGWPALDSFTVCTDAIRPWWLPQFLAMRAATNAVSTMMLSPWMERFTLPHDMQDPEIRWLRDGFSRGLMDGISRGHDFYIDEHGMRIKDFEYVEVPELPLCFLCAIELDRVDWRSDVDEDARQTDEAITEVFKMTSEVVRARGVGRELKKKKLQKRGVGHSKISAKRKSHRYDCAEDFSLAIRQTPSLNQFESRDNARIQRYAQQGNT
ncbi:F-box domain-containing protein [Mycena sanguinolenta]|uniref:F-box domain-containing protein n=1 Tax=Mycena sanguinolenta TaxID=230812 RepID=A0A8H6XR90_9AGAR|nr:F-box domain-containing protein [Mycena sanguinolenta]